MRNSGLEMFKQFYFEPFYKHKKCMLEKQISMLSVKLMVRPPTPFFLECGGVPTKSAPEAVIWNDRPLLYKFIQA